LTGRAADRPCIAPAELHGEVLRYVYNPRRLEVLKKCAVAKGKIVRITHEKDGDYHILLQLAPVYRPLLRQGQKYLVTEVIPHDQPKVHIPRVGTNVTVTGAWVFDRNHGWNELHPVWSIR
jgi:hypothetical protein